MSDWLFAILAIGIMALVTVALRLLPFLVFGGNKETPKFITYLGNVLPFAIMGMLVIYCMKKSDISGYTQYWMLPEIIASLLVVGLHIWKHNTLISLICGTACYMVLIQLVFPYIWSII